MARFKSPKKTFDISLLGDKDLARKFSKFERQHQRRLLSPVLRASAKRTKTRLVKNVSGRVLGVRTGKTKAAYRGARVKNGGGRTKTRLTIGAVLPDREAFGIDSEAKYFYPFALEYGSKRGIKPRRQMRSAIDDFKIQELNTIARDLRKRIEAFW